MVLAGAICAFVVLVERPARQIRDRAIDTRLFPQLSVTNVTGFQILPAERLEIVVEKTNDSWHLRKPISYPANAEFIEALITNLAALTWQTHVGAEELKDRPNAQEEFGLSKPQFALKIQSIGSQQHLLVGAKSVVGNEVFVQFVGGDGLYLVDAQWLNLVPRRPEEWRDPAMLPFGIVNATGIDIRAGTRGLKLELNPTNQLWRMTRPIEARANPLKIASLLSNLTTVNIAAYVDENPNLDFERFGLPNTAGQAPQLELSFQQGTNVIAGLQIGNSLTNAPEFVFARHLDRDSVFVVPKAPFNAWLVPHAEFRDRHLVRFSTNQVESIQRIGSNSFSIKRENDAKWIVTDKVTFSADGEAISDLLAAVSTIDVIFENDVVTDFGSYGLTNPVVELTISGKMTNALLGKVEISQEQLRFGTNGSDKVFVRRNDESRVYSIHPQEFALIPQMSWQFAAKQIWNFKASNVVSVLIEQNGKSRKVLRTGANEWSIAPGYQGIVNPYLLEEAVHRLGNLKAIFWTAQGEQTDDRFGFKKNDFRLTLEILKDGKTELLPLSFGDFSGFKLPYAKTVLRGQLVVFEFPLPLYLEFIRRDFSIVPAPLPPQ